MITITDVFELMKSLGMLDLIFKFAAFSIGVRLLLEVYRAILISLVGDDIGTSPSIDWDAEQREAIEHFGDDTDDEEIEDTYPIDVIPTDDVIICSYCKRPNLLTALECEKCGAPLTNRKRASA